MTKISVIVSTFGDPEWAELALSRAIPSATNQTVPAESVYLNHGATLAAARNQGAQEAKGEWLCFLDADDELDPGYLAAMTNVAQRIPEERNWLLQPATIGIVDGRADPFPVVIPAKPLIDGNYMVIGTLVRRSQFLDVGGFEEWPYCEDWDLWLRCWLAGAESVAVPDAIYRVHLRPNSRNNGARVDQVRVYNQIRSRHLQAARLRP